MLTPEMMPAMQGMFASVVATCALDGTPNTTVISQVYYVDETHVALSNQFFSKTIRNVRENPQVAAEITCPDTARMWLLELNFARTETDGPTFEAIDMQIEIIASMTGMSGIFKLRAADIYEVRGVEELPQIAPD